MENKHHAPRKVFAETREHWPILSEAYASDVGDTCRENGLLVSAEEDVLMLFPALNVSRQTAERGLDIFERCV